MTSDSVSLALLNRRLIAHNVWHCLRYTTYATYAMPHTLYAMLCAPIQARAGMGHRGYGRYIYTEDHRSGILTVNHTGK